MELKSLKKKFKDKAFAAGCSRDVIALGAERLGWELDELLDKTLQAMRACEESVAATDADAAIKKRCFAAKNFWIFIVFCL